MEPKKENRLNRTLKFSYISVVVIILIGAVVFKLVYQPTALKDSVAIVFSAFSYIIWGFVIAYFLNPIIMFFQKLCRCKQWLAMIIVYFLFLGLIGLIVGVVVPMVIQNIVTLIEDLPHLIRDADSFIRTKVLTSDVMRDTVATEVFEEWIKDSNAYIMTNIDNWLGIVINNAINVTAILIKFFMGLILSIYMLNDKNKLLLGMKRMIYATMPRDKACKFIRAASRTNIIFKKFIIGKTFDSLVVGLVSYIVLAIMTVPMALLLAVIMTITNMIPSIGPIIGAVPCVLLTLLFNPLKAIWVLIYIIIIQQVDGLLLGPKILGDTLGMSPLLIIAGVFIGGGFFGIFGMFLGPPILAAIRFFVNEYVEKQLDKKGIRVL